MADETQGNPDIQVDNNSIAFESVRVDGPVEGHLIIGSNNVVGFTAEQASAFMAQLSEKFTPRPFDGSCPYKGLAVFEEEDADVFFGRENLVQDLVRRVREFLHGIYYRTIRKRKVICCPGGTDPCPQTGCPSL